LAFYDYVVNSKMTKKEVSDELIKESSGEDDVNAGKLTQTYQHIKHFMRNNSLWESFSSAYRESLDESGKTFFDAEKEMELDSSSRDYELGTKVE
jgi:hypothetical protein